jgi:predicted amidohydrolase
MQNLNVSLIQIPLAWQQPALNRETFAQHIDGLAGTDLILLPEMFNTGFSMEAEKLAETMDGPTVQWMAEMALKSEAVVTGSLIIKTEQGYYNRLVWMRPNGSYGTYDKRHLFRMAREQDYYQAGDGNRIFELNGWLIQPQICYDLRFPVWSRNTQGYDLLLYVANWPAKRRYAWQALLRARAIENLCYVAAVNRIGADGNGFDHAGDSAILDFMGQEIVCRAEEELVTSVELDREALQKYRTRFPAHMDGDSFVLEDRPLAADSVINTI